MKQSDKNSWSSYRLERNQDLNKRENDVDKSVLTDGFKYEVNYSVHKDRSNFDKALTSRWHQNKKRGIRGKNGDRTVKVVIAVMLVFILCLGGLSGYLYYLLKGGRSFFDKNDNIDDSGEKSTEQLVREISNLEAELEGANTEKEALLKELTELKESTSDLVKISERIVELEERISVKDSDIASLTAQLVELQSGYMPDEKTISGIYSMLSDLLISPPLITENRIVEVDVEVYNPDTGENEIQKRTVSIQAERLSNIGICYMDITTGYTYSVNGDAVFDSASVIKAPYVLSLLQLASEEHDRRESLRSAAYLEGREITEEELGSLVYDMDKIIVYTKDQYYAEGSGIIVQSGENIEYSYRDLFELLIKQSDNVAFKVLREEYGYDALRNLVRSNNLTSMNSSLFNMSPKDGCTVMRLIYDFTESGAAYSSLMKNAMIGSAHGTLIPVGANGKTVAHKYGWDVGAYNDIGIVYDEYPYVVSIFSDCDEGTAEIDGYFVQILKLIDMLHEELHN